MAKIAQPPQMYYPSEWNTSNQLNYQQSEKERTASERQRAESERLRQETEEITLCTQRDVSHKFSQRLQNVTFWKQEVETKVKEIQLEIDAVQERKQELEKALHNTNQPLGVAKRCLDFRQKRMGIDLVHDEVEIQLMKEVEVIEGIQTLLQKTYDEIAEQIRRLRSCKYKLEKDLKDKFGALNIDSGCAQLTDRSPGLGYFPGTVKVQPNSILPVEWQDISDENIKNAEQEHIASTTLRSVINSVLEQTQQDLLKQRQTVNSAFYKRIQEVTNARDTLGEHLNQVSREIAAQEENINLLRAALEQKTGPMQLSHTRLSLRSQRPNNELVRDPVQYRLVEEVSEIERSAQQLLERLAESEATLKRLNRNELVLEEDIAIKTNSLQIDQDHCMALRKQMESSSS